jgi:hypothetical protein
MSERHRYILAFYEIDRRYGGPEEGGWWYDCGRRVRMFRVTPNEELAYIWARRANDILQVVQRNKRDVGSVLYSGGRYCCEVYQDSAPQRYCCEMYQDSVPEYYPETRPHYE